MPKVNNSNLEVVVSTSTVEAIFKISGSFGSAIIVLWYPGVREELEGVHKMPNFTDNFSFEGTQPPKG